jgi:hypothetical protein
VNRLVQVLKHLDVLVEHGLLDRIDEKLDEVELEEVELAVVTTHHGQELYLPPDEHELETSYAEVFLLSVSETHRDLRRRRR